MNRHRDDNYHRQLCENLGMAVIATDLDLNIQLWNTTAARMFGAAADQMIGTPIAQIVHQDQREAAVRALQRVVATGETIQHEFQHRDSRGAGRELAGTIAPVLSEKGERIGASVCIRDITRRIVLQSELDESRKMAALGEMGGAIAHHFNNILGGIITSIDYANASGDMAVKSRVLEQVSGALGRATILVNGLLAFAEGDRRTDDLSDLTEIVNNLADETEKKIEGLKIELVVSLPELPVIPLPRAQVSTILENIVQNAIEAMPDGGTLRIDVSLDDGSIIFLIEDTGSGLDDATKSRVFEPFWSTKGGLSIGRGEAMGLGLAIAHGLVNMLGGTITVTSQPGEGACFRVTLPKSSWS